MELIYGTTNPSKLTSMKRQLKGLDITLKGLNELNDQLVEPEETGKEPLDNAKLKAISYFKQIKKPVFSCDSGLYFEEVKAEDQPGVFIKRIQGRDMSYKEMLKFYAAMASRYGGKLTAYYKNAICLVKSDHQIYSYDGVALHSNKFHLVDQPHKTYKEGFPLDSLSVEITSGKYYYDLPREDEKYEIKDGLRTFFLKYV